MTPNPGVYSLSRVVIGNTCCYVFVVVTWLNSSIQQTRVARLNERSKARAESDSSSAYGLAGSIHIQ